LDEPAGIWGAFIHGKNGKNRCQIGINDLIVINPDLTPSRSEENEKSMKKGKRRQKDELRSEYKLSDFPTPMVRGKYAKRLKESSNIVVLRPEVAAVFPNEDAVNSALLSLIELAKATASPTKHSRGRAKKRAA
jgi:hypothetical protein